MQILRTEVQRDHLEQLLHVRPTAALAELIWNALDADATEVEITFEQDLIAGITAIIVTDNGTGISEVDATTGFRNLGGSWKRLGGLTRRDRRVLHGKTGRGRFAALSLGSDVEWRSCAVTADVSYALSITSTRDRLGEFRLSDVLEDADGVEGTKVRIESIVESANVLLTQSARDELVEQFALYLRQYPHASIQIDGRRLDPQSLQTLEKTYVLGPIAVDQRLVTDVLLTVLEWRTPTTRSLYFCNTEGISRHSLQLPTLRAPGFEFSAYLKSSYIQELYDGNDLFIGQVHLGVKALYDSALAQIRDHFRQRLAERASEVVDQWKREGVYPYEGEAKSPMEKTERQVFEVVAVNVNDYLPDFPATDVKTRKLSLRLVRQALESNPGSMQRILIDVLGLPKARQDELAELLESTSLSAIIAAAKIVADRLNFLRSLECMLFEAEAKKQLKERSQLHRILADHTWLFGEGFNMAVADDESLDAVLDKHIKLMGRSERAPNPAPVRGIRGEKQIVDLMLSQRISSRDEEREHLIVELKRPSRKIDEKAFGQITKYAITVAEDERFRDTHTTWTFIAVSNELDGFVEALANQPQRPRGVIHVSEDRHLVVWARTWGQIIEDCRGRLEFFRRHLDYSVNRDKALEQLRRTHEKYFPPALLREEAK